VGEPSQDVSKHTHTPAISLILLISNVQVLRKMNQTQQMFDAQL
jgi:hypothetical protein